MDIEDLSWYDHIVSSMDRTEKALFSFLLPRDLNFSSRDVVIRRGLLVRGVANKNVLRSSSSSILKCLFDDYGPKVAGKFIDECQFLSNRYMLYTGYSIGIDDCVTISRQTIEKVVQGSLLPDADDLPKHVLLIYLNNTKDKVMGMAKQQLSSMSKNGFMTSVNSRAKGSLFNVCQMTGMLAQQYINGERLRPVDKNVTGIRQRGFITGSFGVGLTPGEFFLHAQSGRTSLCNTALTTSQTEYSQLSSSHCRGCLFKMTTVCGAATRTENMRHVSELTASTLLEKESTICGSSGPSSESNTALHEIR